MIGAREIARNINVRNVRISLEIGIHGSERYSSKSSVHIHSASSYQALDLVCDDKSLLGKGSPRVSQRPRKHEFPIPSG
jgi:hypothetical protein